MYNKYNRVLLKLSGEALANKESGIYPINTSNKSKIHHPSVKKFFALSAAMYFATISIVKIYKIICWLTMC